MTLGPANADFDKFSCGVVCHCAEVEKSSRVENTYGPANSRIVCHCAQLDKSSCGEWMSGTANQEID